MPVFTEIPKHSCNPVKSFAFMVYAIKMQFVFHCDNNFIDLVC